MDYIRVRLLQCEPDDRLKSEELFDPYVVVNILEAQIEPGLTPFWATLIKTASGQPVSSINVKTFFLFWSRFSRFLTFFYFPNVFILKKRWKSSERQAD